MTEADGLLLFRRGCYFEAHEVWESCWLEAPEALRTRLQGLIQAAVALHHLAHGNLTGYERVMLRAELKLAQASDETAREVLSVLRSAGEPGATSHRTSPP